MRSQWIPRLKASVSPVVVLALVCLLHVVPSYGDETIAGYPEQEAFRLGEAMYLKGILPSGAPIKAIVQGDIEISGTMTTCSNCHLRSGLGSIEGGVLTPPTNGARLYAPLVGSNDIPGSVMRRSSFKTARPAYTDESLVRVLREGVGPAGNVLSETMPRYVLDDAAAKIMTFYLKNLSSRISPGVTDDEIRFATIVGRDVAATDRDSLLAPLSAYIVDEWNARLRNQLNQKSTARGQGSGNQVPGGPYRKAALDVWELSGPPDTWRRQLDEYYRKRPVFAILGGVVTGTWKPVHTFCEANRIPCIFPNTDLPVISETDWYTLYLSKGYFQEGEAAAKFLSRVYDLPTGKKVVQVYRTSDEGAALAKGFADTWKKLGNSSLVKKVVPASEKTGNSFWKKLARAYPGAVILVWLPPADLSGIDALAGAGVKRPTLFVSATMLAGSYASLPGSVRDMTFLTYPNRLPDDGAYARTLVSDWHRYKNLPLTNMKVASNTFLITNLLSKVLIEMGGDVYRDYFLDIWDGGKDETNGFAEYPVISFGPGQRYVSKGCYVVTLSKGGNQGQEIVRQSDWVIY